MTRIIIDWKTRQKISFSDKELFRLNGQNTNRFQDVMERIPYPLPDPTKLDIIAHTWMPNFWIDGMDENIRF